MQQSRQQKGAIFTRKVPMDSLSSVLDGIVHSDQNVFLACTLHRTKLAHWLYQLAKFELNFFCDQHISKTVKNLHLLTPLCCQL